MSQTTEVALVGIVSAFLLQHGLRMKPPQDSSPEALYLRIVKLGSLVMGIGGIVSVLCALLLD